MRAVVQRVSEASVSVNGDIVASINSGLLVLVGFHRDDSPADSQYIINKTTGLRIFEDENGLMNLSVSDTCGEILVVSQFTLYGDVRKGKRPSFSDSMPPAEAQKFYNSFINSFREHFSAIKSGVFGADMEVALKNSGPVTIMLDSSRAF